MTPEQYDGLLLQRREKYRKWFCEHIHEDVQHNVSTSSEPLHNNQSLVSADHVTMLLPTNETTLMKSNSTSGDNPNP